MQVLCCTLYSASIERRPLQLRTENGASSFRREEKDEEKRGEKGSEERVERKHGEREREKESEGERVAVRIRDRVRGGWKKAGECECEQKKGSSECYDRARCVGERRPRVESHRQHTAPFGFGTARERERGRPRFEGFSMPASFGVQSAGCLPTRPWPSVRIG